MTDEQLAVLEPLIGACRPHAKVPRPICAARSQRSSGGTRTGRSAVPAALGPWWMAAQTFIRWARLGVWEKLLALVQSKGLKLGVMFLDGTNIRAHREAAGAGRKGDLRTSEVTVKRLTGLVAALEPRPA